VADNLVDYIEHFSPNVRDVFDGYRMMDQIAGLAESDRLYLVVKEFVAVDLHPKVVSGQVRTVVIPPKSGSCAMPSFRYEDKTRALLKILTRSSGYWWQLHLDAVLALTGLRVDQNAHPLPRYAAQPI
jgi:hypothetical protein